MMSTSFIYINVFALIIRESYCAVIRDQGSLSVIIHGPDDAEDSLEIGKPFSVVCKLKRERNDGTAAFRPSTIFFNCPFRPENDQKISCFQDCDQLCRNDNNCQNYGILSAINCEASKSQQDDLVYRYRFPILKTEYIGKESFSCKFKGVETKLVTLNLPSKPIERDDLVTTTTTTEKPTPISTATTTTMISAPIKINTAFDLDVDSVLPEPGSEEILSCETDELPNDWYKGDLNDLLSNFVITKKHITLLIVCVFCISVFLNIFCCCRCLTIKCYSRKSPSHCLKWLFCMDAEMKEVLYKRKFYSERSGRKPSIPCVANNLHNLGLMGNSQRYGDMPLYLDQRSGYCGHQSENGSISVPFKRMCENRNSGSGMSSVVNQNSLDSHTCNQPILISSRHNDTMSFPSYSLIKSPNFAPVQMHTTPLQVIDGSKIYLIPDSQSINTSMGDSDLASPMNADPSHQLLERGAPVGMVYMQKATSPDDSGAIMCHGSISTESSVRSSKRGGTQYGKSLYSSLNPKAAYMNLYDSKTGLENMQTFDIKRKDTSDSGLGHQIINVKTRRSENNSQPTEDDVSDFSDGNLAPHLSVDRSGGLINNFVHTNQLLVKKGPLGI